MFLVPKNDYCDASGRHIDYALQGNGQNSYYVREVITVNGNSTDYVNGATLNAFSDWISALGPPIVIQNFLGSQGNPQKGPVASFPLQVQRNIGGWPVLLDQQPIQRTGTDILVANQPCPK